MKNILFVEDNLLVLRLYCEALEKCGLRLQTAGDGFAAIGAMNKAVPDLVILDLQMPRLGGLEVLKYMRNRPETRQTPVIVFSNVYLAELSESVLSLGLDRVVLKDSCSPMNLANMVFDVLEEQKKVGQAAPNASPGSEQVGESATGAPVSAVGRERFLALAESRLPAIWAAHEELGRARDTARQVDAIKTLHGPIKSLAAASGLANNLSLAQALTALELLLRLMLETPSNITPSSLRTVAMAADHLNAVIRIVAPAKTLNRPARALVVESDAASLQTIAGALKELRFDIKSAQDSSEALRIAVGEHFDLAVLAVDRPGVTASEFFWRFRQIEGCEKASIICVTDNADFERRAVTVLREGRDLIGRPIFPAEMAVKTLYLSAA